jgi:hypothetical protein
MNVKFAGQNNSQNNSAYRRLCFCFGLSYLAYGQVKYLQGWQNTRLAWGKKSCKWWTDSP